MHPTTRTLRAPGKTAVARALRVERIARLAMCVAAAALIGLHGGGARAADTAPPTHSLFLSAMAGQQGFDADSTLLADTHAGFSIGFRLNDRHSIELSAGRTDTVTELNTPAGYDNRRIDALWHYFRGATWQPYIASGLGEDEYTRASGELARGTFVNGGAGVFRHLAGPFLLRAEMRAQYQFDEEAWHGVGVLGISCAFGGPYAGPAPHASP